MINPLRGGRPIPRFPSRAEATTTPGASHAHASRANPLIHNNSSAHHHVRRRYVVAYEASEAMEVPMETKAPDAGPTTRDVWMRGLIMLLFMFGFTIGQ